MAEVKKRSLIPEIGTRTFVAGQTGSGKTAFMIWLLMRTEQSPVIIYDTKGEPKYQVLPGVRTVTTQEELDDAYHDQTVDYIIMQPDVTTCNDPDALDEMLYHHYLNYPNSVAVLDELYMFHKNARHGRGLLGLYTRGRSRGITTIAASQRPAWVSGFAISEAQSYFIFYLELEQDKKKIKPALMDLPDPPKFGFYHWMSGERVPTKYGAVKLDKGIDTGYVDNKAGVAIPTIQGDKADDPNAARSKRRGGVFF